jgi:hypothetical protein
MDIATLQSASRRRRRQQSKRAAVETHCQEFVALVVSSPTIEFGKLESQRRHLQYKGKTLVHVQASAQKKDTSKVPIQSSDQDSDNSQTSW